MTISERRETIKEKGFCFNCLCTAHTRNWCPSRHKCMVCQRQHHTLIHVDDTNPTNQNNSNRRRQVTSVFHNRRSSTNSASESPDRRRSQSTSPDPRPQSTHRRNPATKCSTSMRTRPQSNVSERLSHRSRTHVFLPTALARVLTPQGPEKTRLLLNSGGAQTLILRDLVDSLHLKTTKRKSNEYCTINLQSYHDPSAKIQVIGLVKSDISANTPTRTTELKLQSIYEHLPDLADPHFYNPVKVQIVLANDQLPRVLRAGLIQTSSGMPMAQSTIFGWVISGPCNY